MGHMKVSYSSQGVEMSVPRMLTLCPGIIQKNTYSPGSGTVNVTADSAPDATAGMVAITAGCADPEPTANPTAGPVDR